MRLDRDLDQPSLPGLGRDLRRGQHPGHRHDRPADASRGGDRHPRRQLSHERQSPASNPDPAAPRPTVTLPRRRRRHMQTAWGAQPALRRRPLCCGSGAADPSLPRPNPRPSFCNAFSRNSRPLEAASVPRLGPESRRVPQPSIVGTAAAQASALRPSSTPPTIPLSPQTCQLPLMLHTLRVFHHVPSRAVPRARPAAPSWLDLTAALPHPENAAVFKPAPISFGR